MNLTHQTEGLELSLDSVLLDRRRRIVGNGVSSGFDVAEFTTTTQSLSEGSARTVLVDGTLSLDLLTDLTFHSELRYQDHKERLRIDQSDVTVYPTLSTTIGVQTTLDQRTTSRLREASAELEWQAHSSLAVTGGWGWSQEKLRLPDLENADADFVNGTLIEDGYIFGANFRPDAQWSVRGRFRDFGQGSLQLHEIADHHTRQASGAIRFQGDTAFAEVSTLHRRSQNPFADSRTANTTYSLSGAYTPDEELTMHGAYSLSEIDSRTRTNFYFSPSPLPVSTLVGFRGETQTLSAGVDLDLTERLHGSAIGSYTTVHGDFELDMYQWSVDLWVDIPIGRTGVRVEQVDYNEAGNPDDYDAWMTFLYFTTQSTPDSR